MGDKGRPWSRQQLIECLVMQSVQSVLSMPHVELNSVCLFLESSCLSSGTVSKLFFCISYLSSSVAFRLVPFHPLPCLPLRSESQKGCFSQSLNVGVCTPQHRQIRRKIQQTAVWQFEIKHEVLLWVLIKKLFFVSKKYIYSSCKILFYKYEVQLVSCIRYGKRRWL